MLYFFGFGLLSDLANSFSDSVILQSSAFFMILYLFNFVIGIPFSYYSTFEIEEKYGFNKTDIKTFILDKLKGLIITSVFILGLTSLAVLIIDFFSTGFWLWLWLGLSILMILLNMFYADLIVPIFNKLTPLENGELRDKIEAYSKKVGYSLKNIFVIDGSKRSEENIQSMLHWDVNNGVARRAWARNDGAIEAIKDAMDKEPKLVITLPQKAQEGLIDSLFTGE